MSTRVGAFLAAAEEDRVLDDVGVDVARAKPTAQLRIARPRAGIAVGHVLDFLRGQHVRIEARGLVADLHAEQLLDVVADLMGKHDRDQERHLADRVELEVGEVHVEVDGVVRRAVERTHTGAGVRVEGIGRAAAGIDIAGPRNKRLRRCIGLPARDQRVLAGPVVVDVADGGLEEGQQLIGVVRQLTVALDLGQLAGAVIVVRLGCLRRLFLGGVPCPGSGPRRSAC